jgi:probable phosphoglycerate mutase
MQSLIYLIRHGEIDTTSPRRFLGQNDPPLNETGIRQAQALHERLQHIEFSHVFTSPLQRAMQTAGLVSGRAAESIRCIEAFKEIDLGAWEGLTVDEVCSRFPGAYEQRGRDLEHFRPQGGESFGDLATRCYSALLTLAQQFHGPLLVVAHAGVNRVLLSRLRNRPLQRLLEFPQNYCGVNILTFNSQRLQVEAVNLDGVDLIFNASDLEQRGNS